MVYHGPAQQVLPYFESLGTYLISVTLSSLCLCVCVCAGFPCVEHENPADFILDVLTTCEKKSISNDTIVAMDTSRLHPPNQGSK